MQLPQDVFSFQGKQTERKCGVEIDDTVDWLQSLKHFFHQCVISYICSQSNSDGSVFSNFFINASYHILVSSLTLMAMFSEPPELDWLQVYDIVLRTGASLMIRLWLVFIFFFYFL